MAMAVGGGSGGAGQYQRDADDRYFARAADHLHGDLAGGAARTGRSRAAAATSQSEAEQDHDRTVVIQIDKDKNLKINQEDTTWDKLEDRLVDIFKTRADKVVFVKGDPDLEFQTVATAIDIAHSAGIDKVGLMTPRWRKATKWWNGCAAFSSTSQSSRQWAFS